VTLSTDKPPTQVTIDVRDGVAVVELDGPRVLNALHSSTDRALQAAFDELDDRDDVGAILLCGAGSSFCSGSDLREIGSMRDAEIMKQVRLDFQTKNRVAGSTKPVVAAIQGHCVGGGVELAIACDIRVAGDDAQFAMSEVALGGIPGSGGLQRLPQLVGLGVAKEWILTGRRFDAAEALDRGLVTQVWPAAELRTRAFDLAATLAKHSPIAVRFAKAALDPEPPSDRGMVAGYQILAGAAAHADPDYEKRTRGFSDEDSDEDTDG
jgi:enoyl-CoA hydratase/carnithine racemase